MAFKVVSWNVLHDISSDRTHWDLRKDQVFSLIGCIHPDVIGFQETAVHQLQDLTKGLSGHGLYPIPMDSPHKKKNSNSIFYRKTRFDLEKSGAFYLNEDPNNPKSYIPGWESEIPRCSTWARFKCKLTGKSIFLINNHFEKKSAKNSLTARKESAKLLLEKAGIISQNLPFVVTGDFNSNPEESPIKILQEKILYTRQDAKIGKNDKTKTFIGFKVNKPKSFCNHLDYIFCSQGGFRIEEYSVGKIPVIKKKKNFRISDHRPVIVDFTIL